MSSTGASNSITELKVSAHLMTLDAGLFCVFNSPGSSPPDNRTGLPGVRLSAAPATADSDREVSISGFNASGWLGGEDGAALVRVSGGPAQVLVTIYQDPDTDHAAPKLQVIRLTEDAAEAAAAPAQRNQSQAPPQAAPDPSMQDAGQGRTIEVAAHIYGRGDVGGRLGEWMGERGSKRWIEGFGLMPSDEVAPSDIEYQAVLGRGWLSPWSEGGQFCGSRGMSLPILGLRARLRGAAASTHKLAVSASFVDGTEIGPVSDGEPCEAPSLSPLEAFQVTLRPLGGTGKRGVAARKPAAQEAARVPGPAKTTAATSSRGRAAQPLDEAPQKATRAKAAPGASAKTVEPPAAPKAAAKRTPATTRRR